MRTWTYDGTFEGFLTALSLALDGQEPCAIARADKAAEEAGLFSEFAAAGRDPARAAAARELFERHGSAESWHHARYAFLSEAPGAEDALLAYARLLKEKGRAADDMLADARVKRVHELSRSVGGEAHMFKGFVRFSELADGTLYSKIEPEHNILPLLTGHFKARLGAFAWIIHDARRGRAAFHSAGELVFSPITQERALEFAGGEEQVRALWRHFFKTAAIKERVNPKLQRQNVPLKYRKHLTEFE